MSVGCLCSHCDAADCNRRIYQTSHLRDVYYGSDLEYEGTIYTVLSDNTISNATFYCNSSIEETIDSLEIKWQLVVFWIVWVLLIGGLVYGFYYIDNRWLEG